MHLCLCLSGSDFVFFLTTPPTFSFCATATLISWLLTLDWIKDFDSRLYLVSYLTSLASNPSEAYNWNHGPEVNKQALECGLELTLIHFFLYDFNVCITKWLDFTTSITVWVTRHTHTDLVTCDKSSDYSNTFTSQNKCIASSVVLRICKTHTNTFLHFDSSHIHTRTHTHAHAHTRTHTHGHTLHYWITGSLTACRCFICLSSS